MAAPTARRRLLLVSAFDSPAIRDDEAILLGSFNVRRSTGNGPGALLSAAIGPLSADVVFCWFLSVYGAVAVIAASMFGKPSVVVIGGVDVARDRESGYGLWLSPWKSWLAKRALRSASAVLAVSESLRADAIALAGGDGYNGENIRVLPTGYDPAFWTSGDGPRKGVLCVASVDDRPRIRIKGLDVLIEAAKRLPAVEFTVVGVSDRLSGSLGAPSNVRFVAPVERERLREFYRSAAVYAQPSRREGLPAALCEAMLCGCRPVATTVGGMGEAVGATGILVAPGDAAALASALVGSLALPDGAGAACRSRISERYTLSGRAAALTTLFALLK